MGIFKSFKKILKKAAPVIGGTIGFALGGPLGSAAIGSALGAGIGSLAAGYDTDDALKAALLGGIGGYAASGSFFTPKAAALPTQYGSGAMATGELADIAVKSADAPSFFDKAIDFAKENPLTTTAGIGTLAALGAEEPEQQQFKRRPDPVGKSVLGIGFIGDKSYDLDDDEERKKYFEDLREKQGIMPRDREVGIDPIFSASGGEVNGPGTGTSDSVPARLSDGEFVLTAKAVRGAGGGDRDIGAARMYEMMSELERVA
jgi:hypothetical protein